jgi:hypothetical protein
MVIDLENYKDGDFLVGPVCAPSIVTPTSALTARVSLLLSYFKLLVPLIHMTCSDVLYGVDV